MAPDWLGSPQHLVAGAMLGAAVVVAGRAQIRPAWLLLALAVGVVATAELLVELAEYPLLFGGNATQRAYYDTIADLAATLTGGITGALAATALVARRRD